MLTAQIAGPVLKVHCSGLACFDIAVARGAAALGTFAARKRGDMNNPFSSDPSQEPVPPLSDQAGAVERESADEAAARARGSSRLAGVGERRECCEISAGESVTRFVQEHPCLSVGLAFGFGVLAGRCLAIDD